MMKFLSPKNCFAIAYLLVLMTFFSCKKDTETFNIPVSGPNQSFTILSENSLYILNALDVKTLSNELVITGLAASEKMLSIDFRPATGDLYGVSSANKIYIIDAYGVARPVSTTAFSPGITPNATVSLDFNPTVDRIRLVTNTGQNLRINPETGLVVSSDPVINGVTGATIFGIAYTNSIAGAASTILYDIDTKTQKLYKQEPANDGKLIEVGNLEVNLGTNVSFDISANNTNALAVGHIGDSTKLYTIDLVKGKATLAGKFPIKTLIQGIAMPTPPVAYAVNNTDKFLIFNPDTDLDPTIKTITGLQASETILGMDMRSNGRLYALGSTSRLYTVDLASGLFTQVGSGAFSTLLSGTSFGFDFNQVTDRLKIVSNTGQNLTINPSDATVTLDPSLISTARISALAYNNNFKGATTTTLYAIDSSTDKLYTQDQTTGTLTAIGDLKFDVESTNGFDIISTKTNNKAYAIFTVAGVSGIYNIDLLTGQLSLQKNFSSGVNAFTLGLRAN